MHILIHATYPMNKAGQVAEVFKKLHGTGTKYKEVSVVARPDVKYGLESHTVLKIEDGMEAGGMQEILETRREYATIEGYAWQMDIVATPEEFAPGGLWELERAKPFQISAAT